MKWQTGAAILGGGTTLVILFMILFNLVGIDYTHSGDINCGKVCESYINVTTWYWKICFDYYKGTKYENETLFKKKIRSRTLHVNLDNIENIISTDPYVPVEWLVPTYGKRWRPLKGGDCWERGKINKIKLIGHKKSGQTVKWNFEVGDVKIDPYWFGVPEIKRGLTWNNICNGSNCTWEGHLKPINYLNGSEWLPINTTFLPSDKPNYDYMIEAGLYDVYFKKYIKNQKPIKIFYEYPFNKSFNMSVNLKPVRLQWRNDYDDVEIINPVQNVTGYITSHIWQSEHHWHNITDTIFYPDIFGYNTNLTFEYNNLRLRKRLYVEPDSLPYPTIPLKGITLDIVWKVEVPDKAKLWIKNNLWDGSTIETNHSLKIKIKNKTMLILPKPITREKFHWEGNNATQAEVRDKYEFRMVSGNAYLSIRTPATFLANGSLMSPFEIDPTIEINISQSSDDAANIGGTTYDDNDDFYYFHSSNLAVANTISGWRFQNLTVGNKQAIDDAYITFSGWRSCSTGCNIRFWGVDTYNSETWASGTNEPKDASITSNMTWYNTTAVETSNGLYATFDVDVTSLVQEIVDISTGDPQTSWASGNNISFVTNGTGGFLKYIKAYTYDHASYPEPKLTVIYTIVTGDTTAPNVSLISPADASTDTDGNITFNCNATDDTDLSNVSLWTNTTGAWHLNQTFCPDTEPNMSEITAILHLDDNVDDSSGYGNNGEIQGSLSYVSGRFNKAIDFTASTANYINISDQAYFSPANNNFSVIMWINPDVTGEQYFASKAEALNYEWALEIQSDNTVKFWMWSLGGLTKCGAISTSTITAGKWYMVGGIFNGTICKVIFNNTVTVAASYGGGIGDGTAEVVLGKRGDDSWNEFDGQIDEFTIYNRSLSDSEVSDIYDTSFYNATFNLTNLADNTYIWNCKAYDFTGNSAFADSNWTFTVSTGVENSCNPNSPLIENYQWNCTDSCTQSDDLNAMGYNLTFNGSGTITITGNISNFSWININNSCFVDITTGSLWDL